MPGSARDEAERLVATVLAMAGGSHRKRDQVGAGLSALAETLTGAVDRLAGAGSTSQKPAAERGGWATGSAECCVCPVCRAIAAARDPSPATAARLASSAGDVATGVARLMRGVSSMAGGRPKPAARPAPPPPSPDEAWSAATREPAAPAATPDDPADPWAAASAAAAEADRGAARARREAADTARTAAQEAARRVAEAAALAERAKAAATDTPQGSDVWAAATADAGVAEVATRAALDHDVAGAPAPGERGGAAGDEAPGDDAV